MDSNNTNSKSFLSENRILIGGAALVGSLLLAYYLLKAPVH